MKKRTVLTCALTAAVLTVAGFGAMDLYGRYALQKQETGSLEAADFVFESNLLFEDTASYTVPWHTKQVEITLSSFKEGKSASAPVLWEVNVYKENELVQTVSGSLDGQESTSVKLEDLSAGTYLVEAVSLSPYTQTLSARFTVQEPESSLEITSSWKESLEGFVRLQASSQDVTATISWPSGWILEADADLDNRQALQADITVPAYGTYTLGWIVPEGETFDPDLIQIAIHEPSKTE